MNKVILMGRLVRDAEIRNSGEKNKLARFSLAVDHRFKKDGEEQTADFLNCVAFRNQADFIEKYGRKGVKFIVEGHIRTGSYTNKDGGKIYTTDIIVENIEFAESKNAGKASAEPRDGEGFMDIPDEVGEEMPFK